MTISPRLQVFQPDHNVGISGFQNLRALQSEVLPVAIGTRNTIHGLLKLRAMDHSHFRLARQNEV
jgi:hypothetical protein